jgi:hypothetical protein
LSFGLVEGAFRLPEEPVFDSETLRASRKIDEKLLKFLEAFLACRRIEIAGDDVVCSDRIGLL